MEDADAEKPCGDFLRAGFFSSFFFFWCILPWSRVDNSNRKFHQMKRLLSC